MNCVRYGRVEVGERDALEGCGWVAVAEAWSCARKFHNGHHMYVCNGRRPGDLGIGRRVETAWPHTCASRSACPRSWAR